MIDTIAIRIHNEQLSQQQINWLNDNIPIRETQICANGRTSVYGNYKNMNIGIHPSSITLDGSLSKFINGHNVGTINFHETRAALYQLQRELGIPILNAEIARIDVAECFFVDSSPIHYLSSLRSTDGYAREIRKSLNNSVCYTHNNVEFVFYNKTNDVVKTPFVVLPSGKDVIRIEARIKSNVRRTLINKSREFAVCYLLSPSFHIRLASFWLKHYSAIVKKHEIYEYPKMESCKDYTHFLLAAFVNHRGINTCFGDLQIIAEQNDWNTRKLTIGRNKIREYHDSSRATVPNKYIKELEQEIQKGYIWQLAHQPMHH